MSRASVGRGTAERGRWHAGRRRMAWAGRSGDGRGRLVRRRHRAPASGRSGLRRQAQSGGPRRRHGQLPQVRRTAPASAQIPSQGPNAGHAGRLNVEKNSKTDFSCAQNKIFRCPDARLRTTIFLNWQARRRVQPKGGFARLAGSHLYFSFASTTSKESGAATVHAQAYFPAQPAPSFEDARISHPDEDQSRPCRHLASSRQGPQAGVGKTRLP